MEALKMPVYKAIELSRIGNIIPRHKLTLVTGLPGTGKSFTLLKFLNCQGIKPFVFNLDDDPTLIKFETLGMSNYKPLVKGFMEGEVTDLDGEVIVIDTYSRLISYLDLKNTLEDQLWITNTLLSLCEKKNYTIIIIGHPADFVTKSSVFNDNPELARSCAEHLHFDRIMATGLKNNPPMYRFSIFKGRDIGGAQSIDNWMRD